MVVDILVRFGMTECKGADSPIKFITPVYNQAKQSIHVTEGRENQENAANIGCLLFMAFAV